MRIIKGYGIMADFQSKELKNISKEGLSQEVYIWKQRKEAEKRLGKKLVSKIIMIIED